MTDTTKGFTLESVVETLNMTSFVPTIRQSKLLDLFRERENRMTEDEKKKEGYYHYRFRLSNNPGRIVLDLMPVGKTDSSSNFFSQRIEKAKGSDNIFRFRSENR